MVKHDPKIWCRKHHLQPVHHAQSSDNQDVLVCQQCALEIPHVVGLVLHPEQPAGSSAASPATPADVLDLIAPEEAAEVHAQAEAEKHHHRKHRR